MPISHPNCVLCYHVVLAKVKSIVFKLHPMKRNGEFIYRLKACYNFNLSLVRSTEVLLPNVKINIVCLTLYEVTGEWRKLHNEELSVLYSLPNIVRVVK